MPESKLNKDELWAAVRADLYTTLSETEFNTFFANAGIKEYTDQKVTFFFINQYIIDSVKKKHLPIITEIVQKITKQEPTIDFVIDSAPKKAKSNKEVGAGPLFEAAKQNTSTQSMAHRAALINPNFTFDNYVMGTNNQLAFSIAQAVSEKPGVIYNPLFIYSGVGLGKTHLIQAIGNNILQNDPDKRVLYVTGERFTNELIDSLRAGRGKGQTPDQFRAKYRKVDVLLIDDIQFIIGKESTQDEFFHTFNTLHMDQKQIVITSDRPPDEFRNLEERVSSRFQSGIIADIQKPDIETRIAILRSRRDRDKDSTPDEVINFVAENIDTNIRELEGSYLQVVTYSRATKSPLNLETAKSVLNEKLKYQRVKPLNLNQIAKAVSSYYSVKVSDLKGKRRNKEIVVPRQMAMYLMHELTETPFTSIGEFLGGRDHTTIMHGVKKSGGGSCNFWKSKTRHAKY